MRSLNGFRLGVIILNYNNFDDTVECVDRIVGSDLIEIVIVDNASPDGSGKLLKQKYLQYECVTYIQVGDNRGYAAGNNIGIRYAAEKLDVDYICVLNNDTLPDVKLFESLCAYLDSNPQCGIAGPVILDDCPEARIQSAGAIIDLRRGSVSPLHQGEQYTPKAGGETCAYISGACLMIRKDDLGTLGYMPECYFLYFEETEWCLRAARRGLESHCVWNCSAVHKGSASASKREGLSAYLMIRNRALFEKRNASMFECTYFVARTTLRAFIRILLGQKEGLSMLGAMIDGLTGRTRREYSYILSDVGVLR